MASANPTVFASPTPLPLIVGVKTSWPVASINPATGASSRPMYVDRILKGAKPADLPFEQAARLDLMLNLKTAETLGLTIPQSLLLRADQIIQ